MKKFWKNNKYGILIFIILFISILTYLTSNVDNYVYFSYVMDYSSGFGPRKLIGSIVNIITGGYVKISFVCKFIVCMFILGSGLISCTCNKLLKETNKHNEEVFKSSVLLLLLYFIGPASVVFLFNSPNNGRLDYYLLIVDICIFILFVNRNRNRIVYYTILSLLTGIALLIHQIFACTYLPVIVALMAYDCINKERVKKKTIIYLTILIGLFLLFVKLNFFSRSSINIEEEMSLLNSKCDYPLYTPAVYYDSYGTIAIHVKDWLLPNLKHLIFGGLLEILLLSPLFYFFYIFWKMVISQVRDKNMKRVYVLMQLSFLMIIPAFFVIVDYVRLFAALIFSQISLILILIYEKDFNITDTCIAFNKTISNHIFEFSAFVLYLSSITLFHSIEFSPIVEHVLKLIGIHLICI